MCDRTFRGRRERRRDTGASAVPILARVHRYNRPWLIVAETPFCLPEASLKDGQPDQNPLELPVLDAQLADGTLSPCAGDWNRAIGRLLTEEDAPRWVLLAGSRVLLIDHHTRAKGRWLAFDLDDAYGRAERATFEHLAAFLSADTLCPGGETDQVLHDRLEAQNHRFAHGVTDSLQFAVREAIERLTREWIADRRRQPARLQPPRRQPDHRRAAQARGADHRLPPAVLLLRRSARRRTRHQPARRDLRGAAGLFRPLSPNAT